MADFSDHQKKIIKRYYDNRDQLDEQRLSDMVANLYLSEGKKRTKLWQQATDMLLRLGVPQSRVDHIVGTDDPAQLAEVVKELLAGLHKGTRKPPPKP